MLTGLLCAFFSFVLLWCVLSAAFFFNSDVLPEALSCNPGYSAVPLGGDDRDSNYGDVESPSSPFERPGMGGGQNVSCV
jgi:hypothetical protein